MADISVQKKSGGDLTWVWAAAAVLAIIGLVVWLMSTQEAATTTAAVETTTGDTVAETTPDAESVELAAVGAAPADFEGRTLAIEAVPIAVELGNRSFWANIPGANPFLVVVGPSVTDVGWLEQGATPSVVGTVQPVTETEVDSWVQANYMQADARPQVAIATHYLLVEQATP